MSIIFSTILFNIVVYVVITLNLFFIFFLFNTRIIKTLNELKYVYNLQYTSISIILSLMSLAGVPPVSGFLSKFLIFIQIFSNKGVVLFLFFIFLNLFSIYFYIQNLRFLMSKGISNVFLYKNYFVYLNTGLSYYINFMNFINIFLILYVEEFILHLNLVSSFIPN